MVDFSSLKKRSGSNLEKLTKAVEAMSSTNSNDDSNEYWKCELDKTGNGYAIIRFLPVSQKDSTNEDAIPWVKYYDHGFQGPNGWYIEKSLTSIGKEDPAGKLNSDLWNSGSESNKEQARKQKRRLHYVSNIYVIKDSKNPQNEGKIFKYTFGKKIFEKITQQMNPQFEDDKAIDPFDFWEGANFKLKIRKVDGYQNYDLSEFDSPSPLFEDDSKLEEVWKNSYSLLEILDPKNFKDYATLEARLKRVLGIDQPKPKFSSAEDYTKKSLEDIEDDMFLKQTVTEPKPQASKFTPVEEEEDDDLSYFQNLIDD